MTFTREWQKEDGTWVRLVFRYIERHRSGRPWVMDVRTRPTKRHSWVSQMPGDSMERRRMSVQEDWNLHWKAVLKVIDLVELNDCIHDATEQLRESLRDALLHPIENPEPGTKGH